MKPETYARAMWFLLQEGAPPRKIVAKVRKALESRGGLSLWPRVARAFKVLAERAMRRHRAVIMVARKKDEKAARRESGARSAELVLDPSLIGGWRFEGREELVDATFKRHLLALYNRISG